MALVPSVNDTDVNLLRKICWNEYSYATNFGVTGLTPPNLNDDDFILLKKWCYITAAALDHHP
jgi:hypothetical protein